MQKHILNGFAGRGGTSHKKIICSRLMKKESKAAVPPEFTDGEGKKWIQTSAEDLLSMKELSDVIKNIESDRTDNEVILAHIDFKRVDREYYEAIKLLEEQLKKKDELLKNLILKSKTIIDRKK